MGDVLKVRLCATTIMGRLSATAQYFSCSFYFFLLLFKSHQEVRRLGGTQPACWPVLVMLSGIRSAKRHGRLAPGITVAAFQNCSHFFHQSEQQGRSQTKCVFLSCCKQKQGAAKIYQSTVFSPQGQSFRSSTKDDSGSDDCPS